MRKYYCFAGVEIEIQIPDDVCYVQEGNLAYFSVDNVSNPDVYHFQIVDQISPPSGCEIFSEPDLRTYQDGESVERYFGEVKESWKGAQYCVRDSGKQHFVKLKKTVFSNRIGVKTILTVIGSEHLVAQNEGFIFHCSFIEYEGSAVLFTAPSGTGKTTQAELWKKYRGSQIINGDRAVVRKVNKVIVAEGIPYSGSSKDCINKSMPLKAIIYLGQAEKNSIHRLNGYEVFARVWEGVSVNHWNRKDVEIVSDIIADIGKTIPFYYMKCTPDESAVRLLEEELRK